MTYARLSIWRFKKGQQQIGLKALYDNYLPKIRTAKSYRGSLHLEDLNDPDTVVFVTIWASEEAFSDSMKEIFTQASKDLKDNFMIMPDVSLFKVKSAELFYE